MIQDNLNSIGALGSSSDNTHAKSALGDITPMLDILFIMLIFFMLTTGSVNHTLELALPESASDELPLADPKEKISVEVTDSRFHVDGKSFRGKDAFRRHLAKLKTSAPNRELILASDRNAQIQRLLTALTIIKAEGFEAAHILTTTEEKSP